MKSILSGLNLFTSKSKKVNSFLDQAEDYIKTGDLGQAAKAENLARRYYEGGDDKIDQRFREIMVLFANYRQGDVGDCVRG